MIDEVTSTTMRIDSLDVLRDNYCITPITRERKRCDMKSFILLLVSITSASCISAPRTEFTGSDGKLIAAVSCNGWFQTMDDCRQYANDVCSAGYEPIQLASGTDTVSKRGGLGDVPAQKLTIACR